jgi:hypothetical protein
VLRRGLLREYPQESDLALWLAHRDDLIEHEREPGVTEQATVLVGIVTAEEHRDTQPLSGPVRAFIGA